MAQGTVKEYDEEQRTGTVLTDDLAEVEVDATSIEGAGIRSLRLGQRVKFDLVEEGGRRVARTLRLVTFD
ncbi:MAG TPA: cold shock domain-containing protein [Actinomycetota bacterium]|jgi:cold shock CspA family protein|nr:cold shock domain-containing protein [Actinomycetota bacterium]